MAGGTPLGPQSAADLALALQAEQRSWLQGPSWQAALHLLILAWWWNHAEGLGLVQRLPQGHQS